MPYKPSPKIQQQQAPLNAAAISQIDPKPDLVASAPEDDEYLNLDQQQQSDQQQDQQQSDQQQPQQQMSNNVNVQYRTEESKMPPNPEDCNVFPSLFGDADEDCYIEQPLPHVQELIKQVLYEKISSVGSRVIMNALLATGNEALVKAILAKSLTQQQADRLKQVSLDPKVAEALKQVKGRLLKGVEASVASVQENVLPQLQNAAGELVSGTFSSILDDLKDIPPLGAVSSVITGANTLLNAANAMPEIQQKFENAIQPAEAAMGQIGTLTDALSTAADDASNAAAGVSNAAAGAANQVSNAAAGAGAGAVANQVSNTAAGAVSNVTSGVSNPVANLDPNAKPDPKQQGGGSRTRRRIHKLSRRIERTLRRIQKKYGLQDKNHFLRRTLKRK